MVKLSKIRLAKRSFIFVAFIVSILAGVFTTVKMIKTFQVNATDNDNQVTVTQGNWVIWKNDSGLSTPKLTIKPGEYSAYCVDPNTPAPEGPYNKESAYDSENLIKLAIYIASAGNTTTNSIMGNWFNSDNIDSYWTTTHSPQVNVSTEEGLKDFKYVFIHIVVGHLAHKNNQDLAERINTYLSDKDKELLNKIEGDLANFVNNQEDVWLMAKNYKLYNIVLSGQNIQNIVWIENDPELGNLEAQKYDRATESYTTLQGSASLSGIKFEVYNNSNTRFYNPSTGEFYNNGALVASGLTDANGKVEFSNLPLNIEYQIKEVAGGSNVSYKLTAPEQTAIINNNGSTITKKFYNDVVRGNLKFTKTSSTGDEDPSPMAGVVFKITSKTTGESHTITSDANGVVDTSKANIWFGAGDRVTTKGALPYDTYIITEEACDANQFCYDIDSKKIEVTINQDSVTPVDLGEWDNNCAEFSLQTVAVDKSDDDKFIVAGENATIKDTIDYCLKTDTDFTIKGVLMDKATGEKLLIDNQPIEASIDIKSEEACGSTEMEFKFDATGLDGTDIVVFEYLYYGDELVTSHEDIDDESQTVTIISFATTAVDNSDDDKLLAFDQDVEIKDTVQYCLAKDKKFTIKGVLMDKITKEPVLVDGEKVEESITFTPEENCGKAYIIFSFNTHNLGGSELVVFEDLYYQDELVLSHADFEDEAQSISVAPVVPDSGNITGIIQGEVSCNSQMFIVLAVGSIGIYVLVRISSRKRFFGKKS